MNRTKKASQKQPDNLKAKLQLLTKLNEAKISIKDDGTISADNLEKELGL